MNIHFYKYYTKSCLLLTAMVAKNISKGARKIKIMYYTLEFFASIAVKVTVNKILFRFLFSAFAS